MSTRTEQAKVRRQLLDQVHRIWVEGVLDRSLVQVAHMELGLAGRPDAVSQPWGTLLHRPDQPDEQLPRGTSINQIAGRLGQHLLILGGPGAGKTTLLLEYAADLLQQAGRDAAAPIPVVFHLSAWPAEQPPLEGWLVQELALRYGVSRRLAVELVARDLLAVLLDGLDEVPQARRDACVEAINTFRSEHGGVPMVVCTRTREYGALAAQLALNGAVEVQPLVRGQIQEWLAAAGRPLAGLRAALRDVDHWLWELLDSPLLLSIAAITYKGQPARAISQGSVEGLLGAYVDQMLARPRAPLAGQRDAVAYADAETLAWLGWLAERMDEQSVFHPDWMQADWLPTRLQQWLTTTGLGIVAVLIGGLTGWLVGGLSGLRVGALLGMLGGMLTVGSAMGLTGHTSRIQPIEPTRWSWRAAQGGLLSALISALIIVPIGVVYFALLGATLFAGLVVGLIGGLIAALAVLLTSGFESRPYVQPAAPLEGIRLAAKLARRSSLISGLVVVLVAVSISVLVSRQFGSISLGGPLIVLGRGLGLGLIVGLGVGLHSGGASYLRHRLLVLLLRRQGFIPADLVGFLDYADARILLRRAGGGYLFIHRLLQNHFATQATHGDSGTRLQDANVGS